MKKKSPEQKLKSFSWTYIILAALIAILALVALFVPAVKDVIVEHATEKNTYQLFVATLVTQIVIYIWYFWLARRVADGKSKGTLYMVLLALGAIGGIISIFAGPTKGSGSLDLALNIVGLYFVTKIRNK